MTTPWPRCFLFWASVASSVKWKPQHSASLPHKRNDSRTANVRPVCKAKARPRLSLSATPLQDVCGWLGRVRNFKLRDFNSTRVEETWGSLFSTAETPGAQHHPFPQLVWLRPRHHPPADWLPGELSPSPESHKHLNPFPRPTPGLSPGSSR